METEFILEDTLPSKVIFFRGASRLTGGRAAAAEENETGEETHDVEG